MQAVKKLRTLDKTVAVVFVTNLAQYAVKGYSVHAFDFIVKPVTYYTFALKMNGLCEYLKKNKKYVPEAQNELSEDVFSTDFVQDFADKKTAFRVHKVLHKLSEPYKEVFSLRVFGELSFSDISDLFGKSESWARVTYHRACKKIREELDDEDHL